MPKNAINFARRYGARIATGATSLALSGLAMAQSTNPADPAAALQELSGQNTGMGPAMYGLAVVAVGILIGVKWIKRARGAA